LGNHVQGVEYGDIQFAKTEAVLRACAWRGFEGSDAALAELRKGLG
jgi:hypothetical protein